MEKKEFIPIRMIAELTGLTEPEALKDMQGRIEQVRELGLQKLKELRNGR